MASTTAMFTGLSGLTANARNLDVIGNNIANVNTTAYKSNRMLFASMFSRTFSLGSVPGENNGGTNPGQVGLGVAIAGTQRDFRGGALSATGDQRDLAVEGDGFFIVNRGGRPLYTRAGAFRPNSTNDLVTISGERVQGFGVDDQFNIVSGALVDLNIPVGTLTLAEATRNVRFTGNLNAGGNLATQGTRIDFGALSAIGGGPAGAATPLSQIADPSSPASPLFQIGQTIELNGATKGSKIIPTAGFGVTPTSTVQEFMEFLSQAMGIEGGIGPNPDGRTPGVRIDPSTGVITIDGNVGGVNDLAIDASDLRVLDATGSFVGAPLVPARVSTADGESVRTSFVAFDSLGTPITVDLTMVLEGRGTSGTSWRYFVESADDSDLQLQVANGVINFDTFGQLSGNSQITALVNRAGTGALDPLSLTLDLNSVSDRVTALSDVSSTIAATYQDGAPLGTLASYSVGTDGTLTGAFTNGLTRTVGQIALAKFSNPEGLVDIGNNLFTVGPNSGTPVVTAPTTLGSGRVIGGALELSNVELSQEFINLILASTGYSASSRVITTTDQLLQQLLVLGR